MDKNQIVEQQYDMSAPNQMVDMAKVLKQHVVENKLFTNIKGKNYAHVEGWQFAGGLIGLAARVEEVTDLSKEDEKKWLAKVEIARISDGEVVGRGFALCSNTENTKKSFDEYAILSMAQTRAIGKGYRNILGWVMKLAGYEGTPAEEMDSNKKGETSEKVIEFIEEIKKAGTLEKLEFIIMENPSMLKNKAVANAVASKKESLCE